MKPLGSGIRLASFAVWTSLTLAGCLRPDPSKAVATTPAAQPAADEQRLVIWDGARFALAMSVPAAMGGLTFGMVARVGKLRLEAEMPDNSRRQIGRRGRRNRCRSSQGPRVPRGGAWLGRGGLELGRLVAPTAGTDFRPYRSLTFQIRVEPKSRDAAPDPRSVVVLLACSNGKKTLLVRWFRSTTRVSTTASGTR